MTEEQKLHLFTLQKGHCLESSFWFKHIYLAKHRTISTITTFVSVRGFERKLQVAYRVHLLRALFGLRNKIYSCMCFPYKADTVCRAFL